jgi:hypothetical protein
VTRIDPGVVSLVANERQRATEDLADYGLQADAPASGDERSLGLDQRHQIEIVLSHQHEAESQQSGLVGATL